MIIQFILLFLSFYCYTIAPKTMDRSFMTAMLLVAIISVFNCFYRKENNQYLKRQYLRHSSIFLLGFFIVFYQYIIDYVLHIINIDDVQSLIWYDQRVVAKSLCLVNVALNSFLIGYLYKKNNYKNRIAKENMSNNYTFRNLDVLYLFLWCLIIMYVVTVDKRFLFGGYGKNVRIDNSISYHISIWIQGILTAYVVMLSYNLKKQYIKVDLKQYFKIFKKPIFLCSIMIVLILMSGRRTEAIRYMLILMLSYMYIGNVRIKIKNFIIPCFGVTLLLTIIAMMRVESGQTFSESLETAQSLQTISPPTQELAFNISSLHIALSNVPSKIPYLYGIPTLIGFTNIIPGLQPFIVSHLDMPDVMMNSTNLICYAAVGEIRYYTLGTSILADIYVNFGIYGIFLIPAAIGYFLRILEDKTFSLTNNSIWLIGISFCFYSNLIYMCRASLTSPIASLSYVIIFIFLFRTKTTYTSKI